MSSFKGTLSNTEACESIVRGLSDVGISSTELPLGDGGAGTREAVKRVLGGDEVSFTVTGPLNRPTQARVLCLPEAERPHAIYIESADCCGYALVAEKERDAMRATSLGLGELISQSLLRWGGTLERLYVGLGDSAVSDMGMGMLRGLGVEVLDEGGRVLWGNAEALSHVRSLRLPARPPWDHLPVTVLCDVLSPLLGPAGSARSFAPQKGATEGQVRIIEQGMENFATVIQKSVGYAPRFEPMSGAAGGLAAAFLSFFQAELVQGARFLMDLVQFDGLAESHDFLVTGEGRADVYTLSGKAPFLCLERAAALGKKAVVLCGALGEGHEALLRHPAAAGLFACGSEPTAAEALSRRTREVFAQASLLSALKSV